VHGKSSCRLSATGIGFLGILSPLENYAPLTVGLPDLRSGLHRDFHVPHHRDTPGLGAPYIPEPAVSTQPTTRPSVAARHLFQWPGSTTQWRFHLPEFYVTGRHQGFTHVHPPGLPLARCSPDESGPLGFFPGLRTPTGRTCGARQGRDGH
jgi:hypothetical protein